MKCRGGGRECYFPFITNIANSIIITTTAVATITTTTNGPHPQSRPDVVIVNKNNLSVSDVSVKLTKLQIWNTHTSK